MSMKPNMTGLNQTGFGASSRLVDSAVAGFDDFVRAMRVILVEDGLADTFGSLLRGLESPSCPSPNPNRGVRGETRLLGAHA